MQACTVAHCSVRARWERRAFGDYLGQRLHTRCSVGSIDCGEGTGLRVPHRSFRRHLMLLQRWCDTQVRAWPTAGPHRPLWVVTERRKSTLHSVWTFCAHQAQKSADGQRKAAKSPPLHRLRAWAHVFSPVCSDAKSGAPVPVARGRRER